MLLYWSKGHAASSAQVHSWFTMIQHFSRKWEQLVLGQGLYPVSTSFILALGHLQNFLLPDYPCLSAILAATNSITYQSSKHFLGNFSLLSWFAASPASMSSPPEQNEMLPFSDGLQANSACCSYANFTRSILAWGWAAPLSAKG